MIEAETKTIIFASIVVLKQSPKFVAKWLIPHFEKKAKKLLKIATKKPVGTKWRIHNNKKTRVICSNRRLFSNGHKCVWSISDIFTITATHKLKKFAAKQDKKRKIHIFQNNEHELNHKVTLSQSSYAIITIAGLLIDEQTEVHHYSRLVDHWHFLSIARVALSQASTTKL